MGRSSGFILLMTLLMISVVSLLVLACMQHLLLYEKAINALEVQHRNFYQLEALALRLAAKKDADLNKRCVESADKGNHGLKRLLNHRGCSLEEKALKYQYLIEELGDFACLVIGSGDKKYSTHHHLISVIHRSEEGTSDSFVQLRRIYKIKLLPCFSTAHQVPEGISSWQYKASI